LNVFTNDGYLKQQLQMARRLQWAGIASLLIVFLVSCPITFGSQVPPYLILLAYPFLFLGFPLFSMGNNRLKRLRRTPRPDQLLTNELKGFNNKYSLHHYVPVDGRTIMHLLVAPSGLVVMETRDATGAVSCKGGSKGDRWRMRSGMLEWLAGQRMRIGNPSVDLGAAVGQAARLLSSIGKPGVPVRALTVFVRPVELEVDGCQYPAVLLDEARTAVRSLLADMESDREGGSSVDVMLTSEDRRRINTQLAPAKPTATARPASAQR
jgi:hypothetical protein